MAKVQKIAILASGEGTIAQALWEKSLPSQIEFVLSDNPKALVIKKAQEYGLQTYIVPTHRLTRSEHEKEVLKLVQRHKVKWILLAGYMRLLQKNFLKYFYDKKLAHNRVINIHPALLPNYPGLHAYERAFADNVSFSGATVHFVDEGMDTGPIIAQSKINKLPWGDVAGFYNQGKAHGAGTLYFRL